MITPLGEELRELAPNVLSQRAVRRFLGYLNSQREGLLGGGKRNPGEREHVLRAKVGEVPDRQDVVASITGLEVEIADRLASGRTPLPAEPDLVAVSEWSTGAHRRQWASAESA